MKKIINFAECSLTIELYVNTTSHALKIKAYLQGWIISVIPWWVNSTLVYCPWQINDNPEISISQ